MKTSHVSAIDPKDERVLRSICHRLVKQGPLHQVRITEYFRIMLDAAQAEFTEDNIPTLEAFLRECQDDANKLNRGK